MTDPSNQNLPRPRLELRFDDDTVPELRFIAERYWGLTGYDTAGHPVWDEHVRDIDTGGLGSSHLLALAGAYAIAVGRHCKQCGAELVLTARAAFERLARNAPPERCLTCTPTLRQRVAKARGGAIERLSRIAPKPVVSGQESAAPNDQTLRAIVRSALPVVFHPRRPIPEAHVSDELTTLTVIRWQTPDGLPLGIERRRITPLHPGDSGPDYLASAVRSTLLAIHPESPLSAFNWVMPDDNHAHPVLDSTYRAEHARHYTPWGHDDVHAVIAVDRHLTRRLAPDTLDRYRSDELVELARELLTEETLRFLRQQLHTCRLPDPRDQELTEVRHALRRLLGQRRLGEALCLAWRSVRTATEPPYPIGPNTTTAALSWFIRHAEDYTAQPERPMKCFTYLNTGCAAMTWTLFDDLLDMDPLTSSVDSVRQALPRATRASDASTADGTGFPILRCGPCGLPVLPADAWLCLDTSATAQGSSDTPWDVGADIDIDPEGMGGATWLVAHPQCIPDFPSPQDFSLPGDHRGLLAVTARLLHKQWLVDTDYADLLHEATSLTGRFTPADVGRSWSPHSTTHRPDSTATG